MARQKSSIKIEGTLGELSFYSSVFGDIVRRKGGASKERIRKGPEFERLREHQEEFKCCSEAGKVFRNYLYPFTKHAPDHKLVWRVNKLMNQLKDLDKKAIRGKRRAQAGLKTAAGKQLVENFELNSNVVLDNILKCEPFIENRSIAFENLVPKKHIKAPKGTTHVNITGIVSIIDLENKKHDINHTAVKLKLDSKKQSFILKPKRSKEKGFIFYFLMLSFLKEGEAQNPETEKANCLTVLMVEG